MSHSADSAALLSKIPVDGTTIGNMKVRDDLGWDKERYLAARHGLLDQGVIGKGKGTRRCADEKHGPASNPPVVDMFAALDAEDSKPWERDQHAKLNADLETRLSTYFREQSENAYAAFNTMTDFASRPPQSPRFCRDRPTLERRAGAWLREFNVSAALPGFTIAGRLAVLAAEAADP